MDTKILLGELKAFREQITEDVRELKKDVRSLMKQKWQASGAAAAVGAVVGFVTTVIIEIVRH